jgi:hypothetical protein
MAGALEPTFIQSVTALSCAGAARARKAVAEAIINYSILRKGSGKLQKLHRYKPQILGNLIVCFGLRLNLFLGHAWSKLDKSQLFPRSTSKTHRSVITRSTQAERVWQSRKAAIDALGNYGDPTAINYLKPLQENTHLFMRRAATDAVKKLTSK